MCHLNLFITLWAVSQRTQIKVTSLRCWNTRSSFRTLIKWSSSFGQWFLLTGFINHSGIRYSGMLGCQWEMEMCGNMVITGGGGVHHPIIQEKKCTVHAWIHYSYGQEQRQNALSNFFFLKRCYYLLWKKIFSNTLILFNKICFF